MFLLPLEAVLVGDLIDEAPLWHFYDCMFVQRLIVAWLRNQQACPHAPSV